MASDGEGSVTHWISDLKAGERAMFFSQAGHAVLIRCVKEGAASTT